MPVPAKNAEGSARRWTPGRLFSRAGEVLRREGLRSLWFKILGETFYRRLVVAEKRLDEEPPDIEPRCRVTVTLLSEDEIGDYIALRPDAEPAEIRNRLARGERCYVARSEGELVHADWHASGRVFIEYLDCEIDLAPDAAYGYENFTKPEFRGRGISFVRNARVQKDFRKAGFRRLIGCYWPENRPAAGFHGKVGYRRVGVVGFLRFGPWKRYFFRSRDPSPAFTLRLRRPGREGEL